MNYHATAIIFKHYGLLILGKSQTGKTTLANSLIAYAKQNGFFARYIGDDQLELKTYNNKLIAKSLIKGKMERFGYGIEKIQYMDFGLLDLAIELLPKEKIARMPKNKKFKNLPLIEVPENCENLAISLIVNFIKQL